MSVLQNEREATIGERKPVIEEHMPKTGLLDTLTSNRHVLAGKRRTVPFLAMAVLAAALTGCSNSDTDPDIPAVYKDFYRYPNGRSSSSGMLEIRNNVAAPVLLFTSEVSAENYIGTAGSLSSIRVNLAEEKFYTIVAVKKSDYEQKGGAAGQFSDLTYYSHAQPYSIAISSNEMGGGSQWIINNTTDYWVSFKKSDQSGIVYAVAAPKASRVIVPVNFGTSYQYIPHFYKQLKYSGKVVALVEFDDTNQANTVYTTQEYPINRITIGGSGEKDIRPAGADINPAILFTNSSDKNVRVYIGQNNQLTNGGMVGSDFVVISGQTFMFTNTAESATTKLVAGVSTNSINFEIPSQPDVKVSQNILMQKNKVYHVVLDGSVNAYTTTVTEEDASEYFN